MTSSADIYSLGKTIFYILSGGIILPRESIHEEEFRKIFAKGERYGLMEILLRRMICRQDQRIQSVAEVIEQLEKIEAWEKNALLLPVSADTLASIGQLQRQSQEAGRVTEENRRARIQENETLAAVQLSLTEWLRAELEKVALLISSDILRCKVQVAGMPNGQPLKVQAGNTSFYQALNGVEMTLEDANDQLNRQHALQFFFCQHSRFTITVTTGRRVPGPQVQPAKDFEIAILPFYRQTQAHRHPHSPSAMGYFNRKSEIGTIRNRITAPKRPGQIGRPQPYRVNSVSASFDASLSLHEAFRTSEWPGNEERIRELLKEAIASFITYIKTD